MIHPEKRETKQKQATKFVKAEFWMLREGCPFSAATRVVYWVLCSHLTLGRQTGTVWPSVSTIAAEVGISERAVYNSLYELRDAGLITIRSKDGAGRHNEYVIHALSQAQIEAICVSPNLHDVQIQESEPAPRAGSNLHHVQIEPAPRAREVEPEKKTQEKKKTLRLGNRTDWVGSAARTGAAVTSSQGEGQESSPSLTGPWPPIATVPGSLTGAQPKVVPLHATGFPPAPPSSKWGLANLAEAANRGRQGRILYDQPLDDPEMERAVCDLVLYARDKRLTAKPPKDWASWMKSMRIALCKYERTPEEVRHVIDLATSDPGYRHIKAPALINKEWDHILAGTYKHKPRPKKPLADDDLGSPGPSDSFSAWFAGTVSIKGTPTTSAPASDPPDEGAGARFAAKLKATEQQRQDEEKQRQEQEARRAEAEREESRQEWERSALAQREKLMELHNAPMTPERQQHTDALAQEMTILPDAELVKLASVPLRGIEDLDAFDRKRTASAELSARRTAKEQSPAQSDPPPLAPERAADIINSFTAPAAS